MSTEHNSHTMPASNQRMLFLPHLWPALGALGSGSLQRRNLSDLRTQQPLKEQSWCDWHGHQSCPGHREAFLLLFLGAGREKSNALRTRAPQEYRMSGQALPRQFSCYSACPTFWPQKWCINSTVMCWASCCGYCGFASYHHNFNLQATALPVHITLFLLQSHVFTGESWFYSHFSPCAWPMLGFLPALNSFPIIKSKQWCQHFQIRSLDGIRFRSLDVYDPQGLISPCS